MICDLPCLEINLELGLGPLGYLEDANVKSFQKIRPLSTAHRIPRQTLLKWSYSSNSTKCMQKPGNLNKTQETQQRTDQAPEQLENKAKNVKLKRCDTVQIRHSEKENL